MLLNTVGILNNICIIIMHFFFIKMTITLYTYNHVQSGNPLLRTFGSVHTCLINAREHYGKCRQLKDQSECVNYLCHVVIIN